VTGVILKPCIWPHPSTEPFADAPATAGANIKWDGNGSERLKLTSTDTYDSRRLEWFAGEEPTQNFYSVGGHDFLLILKTRYTDEGDLVGTAVDDVASWSGSASRHDDASVDYEANRWGEHFEMIRDANGDWAAVVYDATDPRRATFYRAASQSSVFNPVTGEFDGSSSVSGDSEVTVTGHEINEVPAEKNRFELNLETIFVDANSSHTPPDDEEDASSEYDDTDYPVNSDPPGSVWGAAASGFVSGFFSRKTVSAGLGAVPVVGTVLSVGELGFGYDYIGDEDVDRRVAGVGLVVGLLPGGKPIGKLVAKNVDKLAGPLAKLFSKAPNRIATLESKLASRSMTRVEWKELSQLRRIDANDLQQVSRWGRPGLQPDDWVQLGGPSRLNYVLTGKWQPGFGNTFTPFKNGETYFLPKEQIVWPSGWGVDGWLKGLFNQRIYVGAGL